MKNQLFLVLFLLINLNALEAQTKIFSKESLPKSGEILIYSTSDKDYFGIVKNGEVASAYAKNKVTGKREEVVYNGKSADGKLTEVDGGDTEDAANRIMAKNEGPTSGTPKCTAYQKYECEIVVGRDVATGTTITKKGECVRQIEIECPKGTTRVLDQNIKAGTVNTKSK